MGKISIHCHNEWRAGGCKSRKQRPTVAPFALPDYTSTTTLGRMGCAIMRSTIN